ncbi:MAG: polysaccharide deacetylase family protein [Armatimonadota bacterium]
MREVVARAALMLALAAAGAWAQPAGVTAELVPAPEGATVRVTPEGPLRTRIEVSCSADVGPEPLTVRLDITPRWPHYYLDTMVLDADGRPLTCTWRSSQRNRVEVTVPAQSATYFLQVADPRAGRPPLPDEAQRSVRDPATGLEATICRWFDGRAAALSLRFDDSHPTHILKAVPMLREYGFTGTFFINPGSGDYLAHADEWADCAAEGDQEFANHSMHHRGASSDEEADREIGDASRHIWELFPGRSRLLAWSEGGGTTWTHTRPLREILDRYHLFDAYGQPGISMADSYGERVEAYRQGVDEAIASGGWFTALFHQIGESISDENFRAVLELTRERQDSLWIAGMAAVHKYLTERNAASLRCTAIDGDGVRLTVTCATDRTLYDQPLTIAVTPPAGWEVGQLHVTDAEGTPVQTRARPSEGGAVLLFDVPPVTADYVVRRD